MKICCKGHWVEAQAYFTDPKTLKKMKARGLTIEKMDWKTQTVYIRQIDDDAEALCKILSGIEAVSTR